MIATLQGVVSEKLADVVVLDVQGVGYGVYVTAEDHGRLVSGETAKVYIYEHVREQAHDLFGFLGRDTQSLFDGITLLGCQCRQGFYAYWTTIVILDYSR